MRAEQAANTFCWPESYCVCVCVHVCVCVCERERDRDRARVKAQMRVACVQVFCVYMLCMSVKKTCVEMHVCVTVCLCVYSSY